MFRNWPLVSRVAEGAFEDGYMYGLACCANWLEWDTARGLTPQQIASRIHGKIDQDRFNVRL